MSFAVPNVLKKKNLRIAYLQAERRDGSNVGDTLHGHTARTLERRVLARGHDELGGGGTCRHHDGQGTKHHQGQAPGAAQQQRGGGAARIPSRMPLQNREGRDGAQNTRYE